MDKNERLLRYAGFTLRNCGVPYCNCKRWFVPDGTGYGEPPDLYNSLDAQSKWLWPKLAEKDIWLDLLIKPERSSCALTSPTRLEITSCAYFADTPANACAEAILALIKDE